MSDTDEDYKYKQSNRTENDRIIFYIGWAGNVSLR